MLQTPRGPAAGRCRHRRCSHRLASDEELDPLRLANGGHRCLVTSGCRLVKQRQHICVRCSGSRRQACRQIRVVQIQHRITNTRRESAAASGLLTLMLPRDSKPELASEAAAPPTAGYRVIWAASGASLGGVAARGPHSGGAGLASNSAAQLFLSAGGRRPRF